ncbi:hypothetical protein [Aliikangiella coralliicola]|uniref:Uncharacterized protein n=1 Tax=Aliikangiella coralliicola TaxID=2592383 RepID=A0A545UCU5_9GAMM|nr:hypothetical protein [Aliikangiella coralliicola]TQV87282.1 hypothetical protein FLL46_12585 [Aliikangiella coralliicola]
MQELDDKKFTITIFTNIFLGVLTLICCLLAFNLTVTSVNLSMLGVVINALALVVALSSYMLTKYHQVRAVVRIAIAVELVCLFVLAPTI